MAVAIITEVGRKMRKKGRIRSWNDQKGFGFIEPEDGGKQIFIHISAFSHRSRTPKADEVVTYVLSTDNQGRPCAARATLPGDTLPRRVKRNVKALSVIGAVLFLVVVGILVAGSKLPPIILGLYFIASIATFIMYAVDKSAARRGTRRTPESTLHWLSLIGGWPGGLIAQQTLRHKSMKQSFRTVFWITVFLNVGGLAWIFSPGGLGMVYSWIGDDQSLKTFPDNYLVCFGVNLGDVSPEKRDPHTLEALQYLCRNIASFMGRKDGLDECAVC